MVITLYTDAVVSISRPSSMLRITNRVILPVR